MADIDLFRQKLQHARAEEERAATGALLGGERMRQLDAELERAERAMDRDDPAWARRYETLLKERDQAHHDFRSRREELYAATKEAVNAFTTFAPYTDPREAVTRMADQFPFLLFPVRLETRFGKGPSGASQLWVRVYPDDCSIDTFEADLAEGEVAGARAYWTGMWQAGGVDGGERAAWRGLVASFGSGRAAWIVQNLRPLNEGDQPRKSSPSDVILVIPTDAPPGDDEAKLLAEFWTRTWRAGGEPDAEAEAFREFEDRIGDPARAAELAAAYRPANPGENPPAPLKRDEVDVRAAFVVFPAGVATRRHSWSRAPKVAAFPDRFALVAYRGGVERVEVGRAIPNPLVAGIDPGADEGAGLRPDNGEIVVPDEMKWMVDFDRAVEVGMGFRLHLDAAEAKGGFDRLLVLGVRSSDDPETARRELETLLHHHAHTRTGFALLPQGVPTNNTESEGAGFTTVDDADTSFDELFREGPKYHLKPDWREKSDGQWLAELLGMEPMALARTRHAGGADQAEARAMNTALWPATLGYWMETMMSPVFPRAAVEGTRAFFTRYVSGRGALPAVRIGDQPYGIVPATPFSRLEWPSTHTGIGADRGGEIRPGYVGDLYHVLRAARGDWTARVGELSWAGKKGGDPHQTLLDVIGLHPGSVEWAQRYAESLEQFHNRLNLGGHGHLLDAARIADLVWRGTELLKKLGYQGATPDILHRFFFGRHNALKGPVVDDRPLSETEPVRAYTDGGANYLTWLAEAAGRSLEEVRRQEGFEGGRPPSALLYLLLRHALQNGYHGTSLLLHEEAGLLPKDQVVAARREPSFIHVSPKAARSESRYHFLARPEPKLTGQEGVTVGHFIARRLPDLYPARHLREQIRAVERLQKTPTARLERLLAEHVDCCSYRLDAWMMGVAHCQLAHMRGLRDGDPTPARTGVHLGAYAWLENVRPQPRALTPVRLEGELGAAFGRPGEPPLMRDSANGGFIHAPSLNQAAAAAVLRNGYISNASPANQKTLSVNLTSARVRRALGIVEGIRNGQSLGALLGYQLERGLHDRHGMVEVDKFLLDLRKAFPLRAGRLALADDAAGDAAPISDLEARNVVDGLRLVEHVRKTGLATYPYGQTLPPATAAEAAAIDAEVDRLLESHDAVADLMLAEGVFQAVQGNYDRVASTLDSVGKGAFPPEPEVVQTPTSGTGLTHRVGLHLQSGLHPSDSPVAGVAATPRSSAEPALNRWLAGVLPPLSQVGCRVSYLRAATGAAQSSPVTLADLGVQPLDVLFLLRDEGEQAMSELDDRVVQYAFDALGARPDAGVSVEYMDAGGAPYAIFETIPLVRSLRRLALAARPLAASDVALGIEATVAHDATILADPLRVIAARAAMTTARADLDALRAALAGPLADPVANRAAIVAGIDGWAQQGSARLLAAARFGIPGAGAGFVHEWKRRQFAAVLEKVAARVARWDDRLARFDAFLADYDALPAAASAPLRHRLLKRAEALVTTTLTPAPLPTPADFRALLDTRRAAFVTRRAAWAAVAATTRTAPGALMADVAALPAASAVDFTAFDLRDEEDQAATFAGDLLRATRAAVAELDRRLAASRARLDEHDATPVAADRVAALQAAAKALLGEDFVIIPEFTLLPAQGAELERAVADSPALLADLEAAGTDFPVDDWLYGVARVRDRLRAWEEVVMVAGAMGVAEPALTPVQLPWRADDRWVALEIPAGYPLDGEKLLYTAHFAVPFDRAAPQCGLLLDEWTEVIPADDATTGIAFHYDRPNHEPPQAWLLATPAAFRGSWTWRDLVGALNDTLDLAKERAVEPAHLDRTPYARFLPATVMAATVSQLAISANLAENNSVHTLIRGD